MDARQEYSSITLCVGTGRSARVIPTRACLPAQPTQQNESVGTEAQHKGEPPCGTLRRHDSDRGLEWNMCAASAHIFRHVHALCCALRVSCVDIIGTVFLSLNSGVISCVLAESEWSGDQVSAWLDKARKKIPYQARNTACGRGREGRATDTQQHALNMMAAREIESKLAEQIETIRARVDPPRTCVQLPGCRQPAECQWAFHQCVTTTLIPPLRAPKMSEAASARSP